MSQQERSEYMDSLNRYRTNLSVMKNEREEGRAEGLVEGRMERDKEIVMRLVAKGMDPEEIADMLGMELEAIQLIIDKGRI